MSSTHHGVLIHTIFGTKGRYPLLGESWRKDLYAYIGGTIKEHEAMLLCAGGIENHIHLLLKISPRFAISNTIQLLKQNSSRWINENNLANCKFQRQRGYGVFSVSQSKASTVKSYLGRQKEHHLKQSFEDEYLSTLRKHKINFDKRYLFEDEFIG